MPNQQKRTLIKAIILGDQGVGKTALLHRLVKNSFTQYYKTTVCVDFLTKDICVDGKPVTLQLWDTAGQDRFRSLGAFYFRGADACVLVYDVTQPNSFKSLDSWRDEFLAQAGPREPDKFPFILVGNKVDLESRSVTKKRAGQWAQARGGMPYIECSAKEAVNVDEAFALLARIALARETSAAAADEAALAGELPPAIQLTDAGPESGQRACQC